MKHCWASWINDESLHASPFLAAEFQICCCGVLNISEAAEGLHETRMQTKR